MGDLNTNEADYFADDILTYYRTPELTSSEELVVQTKIAVGEVVKTVLNQAHLTLAADICIVEMLEDKSCVYRAILGLPHHLLGLALDAGSSLSGYCAETDRLIACEDVFQEPLANHEACRKVGIASMALAPIHYVAPSHSPTVGVIKIAYRQQRAFDQYAIETLTMLSGLLSAAISDTLNSIYRNAEAHKKATDIKNKAETFGYFIADSIPGIVATSEPDGYVSWYNRYYYDYTGLTYEEARGDGWKRVMHPDDKQAVIDSRTEALAQGQPYSYVFRLRRAVDQAYRWYKAQAVPMRDSEGHVLRYIVTAMDIHDLKIAEESVKKTQGELDTLMDYVLDLQEGIENYSSLESV